MIRLDLFCFILFYFYALPMCQVLPGLCCLFWSRSASRQLSYSSGCCATAVCRALGRASYAVVCVLADLRARRLEAAFLSLETIIHLPFLFQWRRWRVSTCFSGLSPGDTAEWVKRGDFIK